MNPSLTTTPLTPAVTPAIRAVRVEVIKGADAGIEYAATSERVVIGTHATADFVLTDRTVSRFHCELVLEGDAVTLRDLESRNHTRLDGVEIGSCRLRGPAIITLGETELRIDLHGELPPAKLTNTPAFGALVGESPVMRLAFSRLQHAALRDGHVLIEGERGTGKDAAAAAIHETSARQGGPLDVIDCTGAVLDVEDALFGRGDHAGMLARCHGGTLVLDEVGALAKSTQRMLVRALEDRVVRPPRGDQMPADVRIIALSRRNLRADVNADRFAPDLFELVAATRVRLPPLRERPEDIPLLLRHFVAPPLLLTAESIDTLRAAAWPGNVRELRAFIEHSDTREVSELPLIDTSVTLRDAKQRWTRYFEREYLARLLEQTAGNVAQAAILAGVDRVYLHRMITRCGLRELLRTHRGDD